MTSTDAKGRRRLDDPHDFMRLEISTALNRNVRVIPILVEDAPIPSADALPDDLKPLVRRQAVALRDTRWDADVDDLIALLAKLVHVAPPSVPARTEPERQNSAAAAPIAVLAARDRMDHAPSPARLPARQPKATWPIAAAVLLVLGALTASFVAPMYVPRWLVPHDATPGTVARQAPTARTEAVAHATDVNTPRLEGVEPAAASATQEATPSALGSTVPNVVGQTLERGSAALRRAGLSVGSTASTAARGAAAFQIVSQTPSGGAIAAPGTRVDIVYARPMRTLPNVEGELLEDAIATLAASGFDPQQKARSTNDAPPQRVLRQIPAGGSELEPGAVVELEYAVPAKITAPNVVGLDVRNARTMLRGAGLVPSARIDTNASAPAYQVVRQDPPPGSEVDKNAAVALFYAAEPPPAGAPRP